MAENNIGRLYLHVDGGELLTAAGGLRMIQNSFKGLLPENQTSINRG